MDGSATWLARLDGAAVQESLLGLAELGDGLLAERNGGDHVVLGDLLGARLDHGDVVGGAGDGQLEVGALLLLEGRVDDELPRLDVAADAHAGGGAVERRGAEHQRGGGAHDADGVGLVDLVGDERRGDDVDLALEAVGETGADGAVDHAGGQRALLGRTRLALEVAAGDAAHGVHLLDEVDGQREEVVVLLLLGNDGGHQHGGVALGDQHGAGCLLGQFARLEAVLLTVQLERLDDFLHGAFFLSLRLAGPIARELLRRPYSRFSPSRAETPLRLRPHTLQRTAPLPSTAPPDAERTRR